jgi:hypothetical protein
LQDDRVIDVCQAIGFIKDDIGYVNRYVMLSAVKIQTSKRHAKPRIPT